LKISKAAITFIVIIEEFQIKKRLFSVMFVAVVYASAVLK